MMTSQGRAMHHCMSGEDMLADLARVPWNVAARTYGNAHSTLIGLFVAWWVSSHPGRWALESGPASDHREPGEKASGRCDALFCEDESACGLLEVEGSRHDHTARKIGHFFRAVYQPLASLDFAIFAVYQWSPLGRGKDRRYPPPLDPQTQEQIVAVSMTFPAKRIIVIALDKRRETACLPLRARNDYFSGTLCDVRGLLFQSGRKLCDQVYYQEKV